MLHFLCNSIPGTCVHDHIWDLGNCMCTYPAGTGTGQDWYRWYVVDPPALRCLPAGSFNKQWLALALGPGMLTTLGVTESLSQGSIEVSILEFIPPSSDPLPCSHASRGVRVSNQGQNCRRFFLSESLLVRPIPPASALAISTGKAHHEQNSVLDHLLRDWQAG